ncbi:aminoglycoside phosphotransferase family protein [Bacillus sp. 03113]|uniref:aminoglycoside phosphotransferase family protein n=1 Tax=Bacillus sp. 03113 TaxID=2578211 RepID=UPI001143D12A|nr:aminoglycoside phosphotransferase family protein [Bacillus sp. 03113]
MIQLPNQFVQTIKDVHKHKAEKWLADFDQLIEDCEKRWDMKVLAPFDLSYNFVAPAKRKDGTDVVIKLVVPSEEFLSEVEALTLFNGNGMVKIIDVDLEKGIVILERLIPGKTLASLVDEEEATRIASQVMKKLWIPAPNTSNIPTTRQMEQKLIRIFQKYPEGFGPITKEILQEAVDTFKMMNSRRSNLFLLHGDLHHYNILIGKGESWVAIDPKGLIGDREYDVIQFLLNKLPDYHLETVIEKRIDILVEELNLDKQSILSWGFSHTVLATCWTIQEDGRYDKTFFKAINAFKCLLKNIDY